MTVSVCFPYRQESEWRDKVATWVEARWGTLFPEYELIRGLSSDGPFNRSEAINDAVIRSSGDVILVADLDIVVHRSFVEQAVNRAELGCWGFGFRSYIKLSERDTHRIVDEMDVASDVPVRGSEFYEWSSHTLSGLLAMRRDQFESIGGFDQNFVGWGYEDVAFCKRAEERYGPHLRVEDGYVFHLWHPPTSDTSPVESMKNRDYYEQEYLGLYPPHPEQLHAARVGVEYSVECSVNGRVEPITWDAIGLPAGLVIDKTTGKIYGVPRRSEVTTVVVVVTDAEGTSVQRAYPLEIQSPLPCATEFVVGLYCAWDETYERLIERLKWSTPGLSFYGEYKRLRLVPSVEPHDFALVFNAAEDVKCPLENTFVIVFEPPEIIGEDNPWLGEGHPQYGANIFMFSEETVHEPALGLHIPQATLTNPDVLPSTKRYSCSMICSDSNVTPFHAQRMAIMKALRSTDLDIHFYGRRLALTDDPRVRGEITDDTKDVALRDYAFTIDFENSARGVMTDKFSDPLLNGTIPITNSTGAVKVFPKRSYEYIGFDWPMERQIERIRSIITQDDLTRYDKPVAVAKAMLSSGSVNICEWLHQRITDVH